MRFAISLMLLLSVQFVTAQETAPPKVQKSEAKEMTVQPMSSAAPKLDRPGDERMSWNYAGDFDVPPSHPACQELGGDPRKACNALQVLTEIRSRLKAVPPTTKPVGSARIKVDFDVNQFGDVKQINVDYAGDKGLANQIIVALYGLPKFLPATKEGARAMGHCSFEYAPSLLFEEAGQ